MCTYVCTCVKRIRPHLYRQSYTPTCIQFYPHRVTPPYLYIVLPPPIQIELHTHLYIVLPQPIQIELHPHLYIVLPPQSYTPLPVYSFTPTYIDRVTHPPVYSFTPTYIDRVTSSHLCRQFQFQLSTCIESAIPHPHTTYLLTDQSYNHMKQHSQTCNQRLLRFSVHTCSLCSNDSLCTHHPQYREMFQLHTLPSNFPEHFVLIEKTLSDSSTFYHGPSWRPFSPILARTTKHYILHIILAM